MSQKSKQTLGGEHGFCSITASLIPRNSRTSALWPLPTCVYTILEPRWAIILCKHYVSCCFNSVMEKSHLNDLFGVQSEVKISEKKMGELFVALVCNPGESREMGVLKACRKARWRSHPQRWNSFHLQPQLPVTPSPPSPPGCPLTHTGSLPVGHSATWWSVTGHSWSCDVTGHWELGVRWTHTHRCQTHHRGNIKPQQWFRIKGGVFISSHMLVV